MSCDVNILVLHISYHHHDTPCRRLFHILQMTSHSPSGFTSLFRLRAQGETPSVRNYLTYKSETLKQYVSHRNKVICFISTFTNLFHHRTPHIKWPLNSSLLTFDLWPPLIPYTTLSIHYGITNTLLPFSLNTERPTSIHTHRYDFISIDVSLPHLYELYKVHVDLADLIVTNRT